MTQRLTQEFIKNIYFVDLQVSIGGNIPRQKRANALTGQQNQRDVPNRHKKHLEKTVSLPSPFLPPESGA